MKKTRLIVSVTLLLAMLLAGCGTAEKKEPTTTTEPTSLSPETEETTIETTEAIPVETEDDFVYEGDAYSHYIDNVYNQQIARYKTALSEKWEEDQYFDNNMSALPYHYYEGNPLENVGFGFVDLDNDGSLELVIGAILNAEEDPSVFEIWTLADGEPVMIAQGGSKNRYVLEYAEEDNVWYIVNEATISAGSHATYYLMLSEGKLDVMQAIVFDAAADEQNPWFISYDLEWDASNAEPIDEETANAIMDSHRKYYTALEYIPYIFF